MDRKEAREQTVKEVKSTLILDAARAIFNEKGYFDSKLEDIAAAAGFSKASLYNYYPDKEAIFLSIVLSEYQYINEQIEKTVEAQKPFVETLEAIVHLIVSSFNNRFAFFLNAAHIQNHGEFHAGMCKHKDLMKSVHENIQLIISRFRLIIGRARNLNELSSPIDDETLSIFLGSLIQGTLFHFRIIPKMASQDIDVMCRQIVMFAKHGIGLR